MAAARTKAAEGARRSHRWRRRPTARAGRSRRSRPQTFSPSLTALRTQPGLAHRHLADLIGQKMANPQVADARSQARAAVAVDGSRLG